MSRQRRSTFFDNHRRKNKTSAKFHDSTHSDVLKDSSRTKNMFMEFRNELDDKQDRYEQIVKLGRDITIESKRIIFLLHNTNSDFQNSSKILDEAQTRLQNLCNKNFKSIASLLRNHNAYMYLRAYSSGIQEFIEALLFYQYLRDDKLSPWSVINENFQYTSEDGNFSLLFTQNDYILGLADLTGEFMRRCINNLGVGNIYDCFKICNFVKYLNTGFLGTIYTGNKDLGRKISVLRQSLSKMELVCYNIQIRGSEIPKHMLASVIENSSDVNSDEDEGYF